MRRLLNKLLLVFFCGAAASSLAQSGHYWENDLLRMEMERKMVADGKADHLAVRPWALRDLPQLESDSALVLPGWGKGFWRPADSDAVEFSFMPLVDLGVGYMNDGNNFSFVSGVGMATNIRLGDKLSLYADFMGGGLNAPDYWLHLEDSTGVIPSLGKNRADLGNPSFFTPTARLSYAPSKYFQFELGYGRNSFGYGYRSLMLSDGTFAYPYLKIETDVWKIKYTNLYSMLQGTRPNDDPRPFETKYSTTHYLSWAVSPRFNVGFFENIYWQAEDSLSDRGFDPNYLNPIIFYRTVEFSLGSPDNAMLGIDLSFKASKKLMLYGQLLLDEFLLEEIRDRSKWWANKYGVQLGAKWYDPFQAEGSWIQIEGNLARPFTYTHGSVLQNVAHYNQPLAHQWGTNFFEGVLRGYYEKGDWFGKAEFVYGLYGRDPDSLNFGGNIYKSYENPAMDYGNKIGQGIATHLYYQELEGGIILNRRMNLRASLTYVFRHDNTRGEDPNSTHWIGVRLATRISNVYRDF